MTGKVRYLVLPGLNNSGPGHWQTRWQCRLGPCARVEQADWDRPHCADWVATLEAFVRCDPTPAVLIAHSLGCIAVLHWARSHDTRGIVAALLVAPPDIEADGAPEEIRDFRPLPLAPLPFPSLVIASSNDPYCSWSRSAGFAAAWGSRLARLEDAGHINSDSGFGEWHDGLQRLQGLVETALPGCRVIP